ncbi:unnamed protein product [Blepharisma stoltei]|uniref:Secreted protein n=1 Tax=Blepharisma stoltei TaxID=1481888 RepID=A0AAU9JHB8_9CILI|nr:unnamed protein product [Blepharisma stoltei]
MLSISFLNFSSLYASIFSKSFNFCVFGSEECLGADGDVNFVPRPLKRIVKLLLFCSIDGSVTFSAETSRPSENCCRENWGFVGDGRAGIASIEEKCLHGSFRVHMTQRPCWGSVERSSLTANSNSFLRNSSSAFWSSWPFWFNVASIDSSINKYFSEI